VKQWTLIIPLRFVRRLLHAVVLPATSFAIMLGLALGIALPLAALNAVGIRSGVLALVAAVVGVVSGATGAYMAGDRLNERVRRLRAPIGTASVGVDGVRWRHFGWTDFIGWTRIRDIEERRGTAVLHVEAGPDVVLQVRDAATFVHAAKEAAQRYRDAPTPQPITALELAGENLGDWLARARSLLRGGSYRDADIGEEQCVRIAIDPRAPVSQRIGSAAALSKASDDARARVRVAIEETADPALANALEDALEGRADETAMRRALDRERAPS